MSDYRIYLTQSSEVAGILAAGHKIGVDNVIRISNGMVKEDDRIPELYHGLGYWYCIVERESARPGYQLIFA